MKAAVGDLVFVKFGKQWWPAKLVDYAPDGIKVTEKKPFKAYFYGPKPS